MRRSLSAQPVDSAFAGTPMQCDVASRRLRSFSAVLPRAGYASVSLLWNRAAYVEIPVITISIPNELGGFAKIAGKLAAANINIEYAYVTGVPGTERTMGVFRVSDHDAALALEFDGSSPDQNSNA